MAILVNVMESYRKIVAVCDAELLGKYFEEGQRQLDIKEDFFGGEKISNDAEVVDLLQELAKEDSTFNIVGKNSISAAIKSGVILKKGVMKVKGIPFALSLL